mmetsp:Transcript_49134/g.92108  ORF Transcript_49134/g.92108 Transcript_49134/m.92108 type:complete len:248 (-) Transcript_49134:1032-1775(-)
MLLLHGSQACVSPQVLQLIQKDGIHSSHGIQFRLSKRLHQACDGGLLLCPRQQSTGQLRIARVVPENVGKVCRCELGPHLCELLEAIRLRQFFKEAACSLQSFLASLIDLNPQKLPHARGAVAQCGPHPLHQRPEAPGQAAEVFANLLRAHDNFRKGLREASENRLQVCNCGMIQGHILGKLQELLEGPALPCLLNPVDDGGYWRFKFTPAPHDCMYEDLTIGDQLDGLAVEAQQLLHLLVELFTQL